MQIVDLFLQDLAVVATIVTFLADFVSFALEHESYGLVFWKPLEAILLIYISISPKQIQCNVSLKVSGYISDVCFQ